MADENTEKTEVSEEILAEATKQGWVPQEDWKGDPKLWRPADEFVERGKNIIPIMRKEIENLRMDMKLILDASKQDRARAEERGRKEAEKTYKEELLKLKQQQLKAVENSDTDEYLAIEDKISKLEPPKNEGKQPEQQVNPNFTPWHEKNKWFATDIKNLQEGEDAALTRFANAYAAELLESGREPDAQFFEDVGKEVRKEFPHKFTNAARENPALVGGGENAPSGGKKKLTWGDLPEKAKNAYNRTKARLKNSGMEYSKEDYLRDYQEGE